MLTHVHKVKHLVVGTFEQGLETSPALFTEKAKVTVSDQTLVSVGPARPVSGSRGRVFRSSTGHWSRSDRTLAGCVRSMLTYADVGRVEETLSDRTLGVSGQA